MISVFSWSFCIPFIETCKNHNKSFFILDFAFRFYLLVLLVSHIVSLGNILNMIEVEEKMQNTEITDSTQKTVEPIAELDHKHPLQNR